MSLAQVLTEAMSEIAPTPVFRVTNGSLCATFAAKNESFGSLRVFAEEGSGFTVSVGRFTHSHFECSADDTAAIGAAIDRVMSLCREVLNDEIVCCLLLRGGGCFKRGASAPLWARWFGREFWAWSGPIARP